MTRKETGNERYLHLGQAEEPMEVDALGVSTTKPSNSSESSLQKSIDKLFSKMIALEASQYVMDKKLEGMKKALSCT